MRPAVTALVLSFVGLGLSGCIDTEPGFAAELERSSVTVERQPDGDVVAVELRVHVRVGRFALDGRDFELSRAQVRVSGAPVAEVVLGRPADFDDTLEPGESRTLTIRGESMAGAFPAARDALCSAGEAEVVVTWQAVLQTGDPERPMTMELGTFEGTTSAIQCS
jgi:hypothetical protein